MEKQENIDYIMRVLSSAETGERTPLEIMFCAQSPSVIKSITATIREREDSLRRLDPQEREEIVKTIIQTIKETRNPRNLSANIEMRCLGESTSSIHFVGGPSNAGIRSELQYNGGPSIFDRYDGPTDSFY